MAVEEFGRWTPFGWNMNRELSPLTPEKASAFGVVPGLLA